MKKIDKLSNILPIVTSLSLIIPTSLFANKLVKSSKKPNILFIMSDDHTSQAIGAYGGRLAGLNPTPNIDKLAEQGMLFNNCFVTNSISTPSRACIISGEYNQKNGVLDLNIPLPIDEQYLPIEMKKMGYQTAMVGKWHLHLAPEKFDYYNVFYGQGSYFNPIMYHKNDKDSMMVKIKGIKKKRPGKIIEGFSSDIVTDISLTWLKNRDKTKPFFLMHHFKAPHGKWENHPRYDSYLAKTIIPEPATMWNDMNHGSVASRGLNDCLRDTIMSSIGKRNIRNNMGKMMDVDPNLPDKKYKIEAYQSYIKHYLRCVKGVDDNVKRLIDYLDKTGELDNTIIIYTGDQGLFLGEHDTYDKRWMYEESEHMPFIICYPKLIKPGSKSDAIINNVDFAPTMINLAGGDVPKYMEGESFKSILETGKEPKRWKQCTYYRYWMHMGHNCPAHFGIRTKRYKLIFFYGINFFDNKNKSHISRFQTPAGWELYDLQNDPEELNNIAQDPSYGDVIIKLKKQLVELRKKYDKTDRDYPKIKEIINKHWNDIPVKF